MLQKDTTISGRFPLAVVGVDISEAQIREANLHNEFDNIEYK